MHRALGPSCCSGGLCRGLAPLLCVSGPSWPRSCLVPQEIIQSSLVPCVWDMAHHPASPCPVWVMLGSAPQREASGKDCAKEAAACGQNILSPCSNSVLAPPILVSFSEAGRESQASTLVWAAALPPACCSQCHPSPSSTPTLPSLSPRGRAVAEVKSTNEIFVNILGVLCCMCLYINSWRFTKLAVCPDECNHFWDYRFISLIRSLFSSESYSDLFFFVTCTYSGSVSNVALFFLVRR